MRYCVTVHLGEDGLVLPLNYREVVQALLYHAMPPEVATAAHERVDGQRRFQLFTFSRLKGKLTIYREEKKIHFQSLYFYFSCWDVELAARMAEQLAQGVVFFENFFEITVTVVKPKTHCERIFMLSPVTARRTDKETGRTTYFEPNTMEFSTAIYQNLKRKYRYFYGEDYEGPFAIIAEEETLKSTNAKFENLYIKGYMGNFQLVVSKKAFDLLYQVGLGEKNAQGFGMFEVEEKDVCNR